MRKINLNEYRTPGVRVFAGRDRGAVVRKTVALDDLDKQEEQIEVYVPDDLFSVNSSFFLGMFGPSIKTFGDEGFRSRYTFKGKDIGRTIDECIKETLRTGSPLPRPKK